jgi:peroxiredoxin
LAFSATCAHQLPMVERQLDRFRELSTDVLGISVDSHLANEAFAKQLNLTFPLLSDFRREVCAAYGVLVPERQHSGRAVFLVDRQGKIAYKDVSPAPGDPAQIPNLENVIRTLEKLS